MKLRDLAICEKEDVKGFLLSEDNEEVGPKIRKCKNLLEAAQMIKEEE